MASCPRGGPRFDVHPSLPHIFFTTSSRFPPVLFLSSSLFLNCFSIASSLLLHYFFTASSLLLRVFFSFSSILLHRLFNTPTDRPRSLSLGVGMLKDHEAGVATHDPASKPPISRPCPATTKTIDLPRHRHDRPTETRVCKRITAYAFSQGQPHTK